MFLGSMAACCVVWIGMTASTAVYNESGETNTSAAKASIACIFLFGAVFSIGITLLTYALFNMLLKAPLPRGIIGF